MTLIHVVVKIRQEDRGRGGKRLVDGSKSVADKVEGGGDRERRVKVMKEVVITVVGGRSVVEEVRLSSIDQPLFIWLPHQRQTAARALEVREPKTCSLTPHKARRAPG
jgi:hypothetical protein